MKTFYGTPFNKIPRDLQLAVSGMDSQMDVFKNNIPIAIKEGRKSDASLDKRQLKSYEKAIGKLVK